MAQEPYRGHISMRVNRTQGYFDCEFDSSGRVVLVEGPEEVAQAALLRLSLWQGGWCLDPSHGVPWQQIIGNKNITPEILRAYILEAILRDQRIRRVTELEVIPDNRSRVWIVRWAGETATDEALRTEFHIPWEVV